MANNMMKAYNRRKKKEEAMQTGNIVVELSRMMFLIAAHKEFGMGKQRLKRLNERLAVVQKEFVENTMRNKHDRNHGAADYAANKIVAEYMQIMGGGDGETRSKTYTMSETAHIR